MVLTIGNIQWDFLVAVSLTASDIKVNAAVSDIKVNAAVVVKVVLHTKKTHTYTYL